MVSSREKVDKSRIKISTQSVGDRIMEERKKAGFSVLKLSKRIGISHVQLIKYERNENNPPQEKLRRISNALNCSFEYLLKGGANSSDSFTFEDAVRTARENLNDGDKRKVADYIQLVLHFKDSLENQKRFLILSDSCITEIYHTQRVSMVN